jgi:hypothetical protein
MKQSLGKNLVGMIHNFHSNDTDRQRGSLRTTRTELFSLHLLQRSAETPSIVLPGILNVDV